MRKRSSTAARDALVLRRVDYLRHADGEELGFDGEDGELGPGVPDLDESAPPPRSKHLALRVRTTTPHGERAPSAGEFEVRIPLPGPHQPPGTELPVIVQCLDGASAARAFRTGVINVPAPEAGLCTSVVQAAATIALERKAILGRLRTALEQHDEQGALLAARALAGLR